MCVSDLFPESYIVIIDADPIRESGKPRRFTLDAAIRECNRRAQIAECHAAVEDYEGLVVYQALLSVDLNSPSQPQLRSYIQPSIRKSL